MTTILNGLVGGLLAAGVTYLVTRAMSRRPSLTAVASAGRSGGGSGRSARSIAAVVHLVYGSVAGGVLVALELSVLGVLAVPPTLGEALAVGGGWGLVLAVLTVGYWRVVSPGELDGYRIGRILAVHLAYGLLLGVWIAASWIT